MRTKPYTAKGIARVPCARCGKPSEHQWQFRACAVGRMAWHGLCREHDIQLNARMLRFLRFDNVEALIADYTAASR